MYYQNSYSKRSSNYKLRAVAIFIVLAFFLIVYILLQTPELLPEINFPESIDSTQQNYTHKELVNYALVLTNNDRIAHGLENVTLSETDSAQIHADTMLDYSFFSHWDTNGYKPYMRYTLAGGKGLVAENVAWMYSTGTFDYKEALEDLEWRMMYDDADSNWGHKNNILTPFHNKVSIGISFDKNNLYFVQDFENEYVDWDTLTVSANEVHMKGRILNPELSIEWVGVYYDNPNPLTVGQLEKAPYDAGYDAGSFVGMALPSGWEAVDGLTITADTWAQTGQNFEIKFSLSTAIAQHGEGVYTLYLQTDLENTPTENNSLTSYSLWY